MKETHDVAVGGDGITKIELPNFEVQEEESSSGVSIVSEGDIPFPNARRKTDEVASKYIGELVKIRLKEINRIGYETTKQYNLGYTGNLTQELIEKKKHELRTLLLSNSRAGYVQGEDGAVFAKPEELLTFIHKLRVRSVKQIRTNRAKTGEQHHVYTFFIPEGYQAFCSEISLEVFLRQGGFTYQTALRIYAEQTEKGEIIKRLYTPKEAGVPLFSSCFVHFIVSSRSGLESWQPGKYVSPSQANSINMVYMDINLHEENENQVSI